MTVSFKNTGAPQNACVYLFLSLYASTTHTVTSQSSINNPYLLCLLEWDFIWSIWSVAGTLAACALSTCQAAAEAWKEVHRIVLNHRRILAVCLWEEKNGVNKLAKLIVEHFMMFPMMQSAVFRQCITQKSCDEWGPLHSCVTDFITLHKFPSLIFSHDVQTMLSHSPLMNTLNGHSHSCCSWSCQCVFVFVLGDDTTLWGQMGWKQLGEQRKSRGTLLIYKEFDEERVHV